MLKQKRSRSPMKEEDSVSRGKKELYSRRKNKRVAFSRVMRHSLKEGILFEPVSHKRPDDERDRQRGGCGRERARHSPSVLVLVVHSRRGKSAVSLLGRSSSSRTKGRDDDDVLLAAAKLAASHGALPRTISLGVFPTWQRTYARGCSALAAGGAGEEKERRE
ncbi:hypothetical protein MRX96_042287 [Rhipicephalus microplus]